jgi:hypothetical protein
MILKEDDHDGQRASIAVMRVNAGQGKQWKLGMSPLKA